MFRPNRFTHIVSLAATVLFANGCDTPAPSTPAAPAASGSGSPATAAPSTPIVHTHRAGDAAFVANSYLVETEHGVVAIDAPFTVSEGKAFRAKLDALRKPLLGILVTHAHPDHVNGIGALVAGADATNIPIYALSGVDKSLRAIDAPKRAYWTPIYKEEYPPTTTFPNKIVERRQGRARRRDVHGDRRG